MPNIVPISVFSDTCALPWAKRGVKGQPALWHFQYQEWKGRAYVWATSCDRTACVRFSCWVQLYVLLDTSSIFVFFFSWRGRDWTKGWTERCHIVRVSQCQGVRVSGCQGVTVSGCQGVSVSGCQGVHPAASQATKKPGQEGRNQWFFTDHKTRFHSTHIQLMHTQKSSSSVAHTTWDSPFIVDTASFVAPIWSPCNSIFSFQCSDADFKLFLCKWWNKKKWSENEAVH